MILFCFYSRNYVSWCPICFQCLGQLISFYFIKFCVKKVRCKKWKQLFKVALHNISAKYKLQLTSNWQTQSASSRSWALCRKDLSYCLFLRCQEVVSLVIKSNVIDVLCVVTQSGDTTLETIIGIIMRSLIIWCMRTMNDFSTQIDNQ